MPTPVRNGYEEIEAPSNADGVQAVITRRTGSHLHTATFFKLYDREGETQRTSFFSRKALAGLRQMIDTVDKRMAELEEAAKRETPQPHPGRRA